MDKKILLPIYYKIILAFIGAIILIFPLFGRVENYIILFLCFILTAAWGISLLFAFSKKTVNKHIFNIAVLMSFVSPFLASTLMDSVFIDSLISSGIIFAFCTAGLFYEKHRISRLGK